MTDKTVEERAWWRSGLLQCRPPWRWWILFFSDSLALHFSAVAIQIKSWLNNRFNIRTYNSISFLIRTWIRIFTVLGKVRGHVHNSPSPYFGAPTAHYLFPNYSKQCIVICLVPPFLWPFAWITTPYPSGLLDYPSTSWYFLYTKKTCLVRTIVSNWHCKCLNSYPSFIFHHALMRVRTCYLSDNHNVLAT